MVKILDDNFMVCQDCLMVIANGDYSGLDYAYDDEEAARRQEAIDDGLAHIDGVVIPDDSAKDEEFSTAWCECCNTSLAGSRHHCVILETPDEQTA